ncbi:hypothetical protein APHAL10511_003386 [Amanita phalloides]|nr:hypothetical protein APHAL10511_003386 [Amanita phalloides]
MSLSMLPTSLCPGYRHVEEFGLDEEYESSEEVSYATFDLGNIQPSLIPNSSSFRLIGLDTPTPFLQLSGTVLKGRHDPLLGTELLFTDEKDAQDRNKRSVAYVGGTEQRVTFKEVRLQPKEGESGQGETRPSANMEAGPSTRGAGKTPKTRRRAKGKTKATDEQDAAGSAMDTSVG